MRAPVGATAANAPWVNHCTPNLKNCQLTHDTPGPRQPAIAALQVQITFGGAVFVGGRRQLPRWPQVPLDAGFAHTGIAAVLADALQAALTHWLQPLTADSGDRHG